MVMTRKTTPSLQPAVPPSCSRQRSVREIENAIRGIVRSDEPAVVLSSLARSSNPAFSDACAVELSEGTDGLFQVSFPMPGDAAFPANAGTGLAGASAVPVAGKTVTTAFKAPSGYGYPSFAGVVAHTWTGREPAEDDAIIARLLVDHALAIVQQERLAASAARAEDRAAKLAIELITSRAEGEAAGILMAKHQATREEAVRLLRRMSRASQRELHAVAADVVHAENLRRRLESNVGDPARREHLRIMAPPGH
jgi:ANTAR domain